MSGKPPSALSVRVSWHLNIRRSENPTGTGRGETRATATTQNNHTSTGGIPTTWHRADGTPTDWGRASDPDAPEVDPLAHLTKSHFCGRRRFGRARVSFPRAR